MMKHLSQKRFFQVSLLLLVFMGSFIGVRADESTSAAETVADNLCAQTLANSSAVILTEYESFIDQYTKVDKPTSEQFDNALLFYRYVEDSIRKLYDSSAEISGFNGTTAFANEQLASCRQVRDGIIEFARSYLTTFISGSTASKTTFKVVDGLKAMNSDLKDMSYLFQSTFPGQFTEMSNALSCYAHECLSK